MPWKVSGFMNERMRFVVRLQSGERMSDLCQEFGISRKTGYKFWNRFREHGPQGLCDESKCPHRRPTEVTEKLQKLITEFKQKHSTWGPKKIKAELERRYTGVYIPAEVTIYRILDDHGLVKKYKKRRRVPLCTNALNISEAPNDLWCADFKGQFQLENRLYCYPLTVSDHYSRYFLGCEGLENTRGTGAKGAFEAVFRQYGLPYRIRVDNGSPFTSRGVAGLSKLSIWWLRLGIAVERIEPGHPEQNGRHERLHLTLKQETTRPASANFLQQQERFDKFLDEYNYRRPHEALKMKRPADIYVKSPRPYPDELPDIKYPFHDLTRKVANNGDVYLIGNRYHKFYLGKAFAGQVVGLREIEEERWLVSFMHYDLGYVDEKTLYFDGMESVE